VKFVFPYKEFTLLVAAVAAVIFFSARLNDLGVFNPVKEAWYGVLNTIKSGTGAESNHVVDPLDSGMWLYTYSTLPAGFVKAGDTLFYKAPERISVTALSKIATPYTRYLSSRQLEKVIIKTNALTAPSISPGQTILITHSSDPLTLSFKNRKKPPVSFSRGIYFTGNSMGRESIINTVLKYKDVGINAVVFDVKDVGGDITYYSRVPEVQDMNLHKHHSIDDMRKLVAELKKNGIYVIARIACFRDILIAKNKRDWAIQTPSGGLWNQSSGEIWCDPTSRGMQDYIISLAIEMTDYGVDEIQLDYIRFPTSGNLSEARYAYDFGKKNHEQTISEFLQRIAAEVHSRNVNLSIDIFGIVAWGDEKDIRSTGQRISLLAPHIDVISPMLYPSHFNDEFDGFANPGDQPYHFISKGIKLIKEQAPNIVVRPWLQAFAWRTSTYGPDYIREQVRGVNDADGKGYLFWSASNSYDAVYKAMNKLPDGKK
jgi:hypothetical protein